MTTRIVTFVNLMELFMKTTLLLIALSSLMMTACNVKSPDKIKDETDAIIKKSQQDMDELTSPLYRGGQPGKITIKGIIVKKDGDNTVLDERIKLEQIGGKGNHDVSQTLVSDKNKAVLSDSTDAKATSKLADSKKYINLGCTNLSTEEIDGLEEDSNKALTESVLILSAKKIFICGAQEISQSTVNLAADQLILKDASLKVKSTLGSLTLSAEKIELVGANTIATIGLDSTINVMEAPTIDLTVNSEISGEGTLQVTSTGGNCIEEKK